MSYSYLFKYIIIGDTGVSSRPSTRRAPRPARVLSETSFFSTARTTRPAVPARRTTRRTQGNGEDPRRGVFPVISRNLSISSSELRP